jgi:hypothetical protein
MIGAILDPTEEQLAYVKEICDVLHVDEPAELTRECYANFISEYKEKLYNKRADHSKNDRFMLWN